MVVMMIMRASPNTARAESENSKNLHQRFGQTGSGQDRVMLLIVIDYEKPENEQTGEDTAGNLARQMKVPESSRDCAHHQTGCRKNTPPTPRGRINRVRFRY